MVVNRDPNARSPPPPSFRDVAAEKDDSPGPSKKPKTTTNDIQRRHLEKLFANPDKEVALPEPLREKVLRAPVDMMKNVGGSSAGAGSGEFHVYKAARRREFERLKIMSDQQDALDEQAQFAARQAARDAAAEEKTAKNRAKRQKRKAGRKGGKGDGEDGSAPGAVTGKRKLENPNAGVAFRRPGQDSDEGEDDEAGDGPNGAAGAAGPSASTVEDGQAAILIHDDD